MNSIAIKFSDVLNGLLVTVLWKVLPYVSKYIEKKPFLILLTELSLKVEEYMPLWKNLHQRFGVEGRNKIGQLVYQIEPSKLSSENLSAYNDQAEYLLSRPVFDLKSKPILKISERDINKLTLELSDMEIFLLEKFVTIELIPDEITELVPEVERAEESRS